VRPEVFLDSGYAIALAAVTDQYHAQALVLAHELEAAGTRMVTTQPVLLEIGNALAKQRYRAAALQLLARWRRIRCPNRAPERRAVREGV